MIPNNIEELKTKIDAADKAYAQGTPLMPDSAYDALVAKLAELEGQSPPVMNDTIGGLTTFPHYKPMGSLEKVRTEPELEAFLTRFNTTGKPLHLAVEPKLDGLASSLHYQDGLLVRVVTRGDGVNGEDVTHNLACIEGVPKVLPDGRDTGILEVRGEVVMLFDEFNRVNTLREAAGEQPYANPRNLAIGTLGQKVLSDDRKLTFIAYGVGRMDKPMAPAGGSYNILRVFLRGRGFTVPNMCFWAHDWKELLEAVYAIRDYRKTAPYLTDGAVIKANNFEVRETLGDSRTGPRWACAFKYPPEQARTLLRSITLQTGRTGTLVPVAELEPVTLAGSTIARCTLHNADEIARKDIRVGDIIILEKAGEIIPQIVGVDLTKRPEGLAPYDIEAEIKALGLEAVRVPGQAAYKLVQVNDVVLIRRLVHFASKNCMDIDSLGPEGAEAIVRQHLRSPLDKFHQVDLMGLSANLLGYILGSDKVGKTVYDNIQQAKTRPLHRLIAGLGIPNVGTNTSKTLARVFKNLQALSQAKIEDFVRYSKGPKGGTVAESVIPDIGPITGASIVAYWADPANAEVVVKLQDAGVVTEVVEEKVVEAAGVAGLTFVVTGTLRMPRDQAHAMIEKSGGKVGGSVSKKTNILVVGSDAGAAKLTKAAELGIKVLSEQEFLELFQNN